MQNRWMTAMGLSGLLVIGGLAAAQGGPDRPFGPQGGPPPFDHEMMGLIGKGPHHGPGLGQWWNHPEIQKKLELSDDQVSQLSKKRLEVEKGMIEAQAKLKIARLELDELIRDKSSSQEAIDAKVNEVGDALREAVRSMVHQKIAFRDILNEEQLNDIEKFMSERRHRMGERMWEGRRGDGPPWMHRDGDRRPDGKDRDRGPDGKDRDDRRGKDKVKPDKKSEGPEGPPRGRREFGGGPEGQPPGPVGPPQPGPRPDDALGGPLPPPGGFPGGPGGDGPPPPQPGIELPDRPSPPGGSSDGLLEPDVELGAALDSLMADFE